VRTCSARRRGSCSRWGEGGADIGRSRLFLLTSVASLGFLLLLAACTTAPVRTHRAADLPEAEPDPLALIRIAFPAGVPVAASVITTKPVGTTSEVLSCVEHENVVGFVPASDVDFVNLYLVRQHPGDRRFEDPPRYLVVELWRYRPAADVKVRHQWVIWQDEPPLAPSRADYSVVIEDFGNRVLSERSVGMDPAVLERIGRFFTDAIVFFSEHPPQPGQPPPSRDSVQRAGSDGSRGTDGSG
jgi:hypothetical protein